MNKKIKIPEPTIERLPLYFRCLSEFKKNDVAIVSSEEIAVHTGLKASQFRKDLSYFGEFGIQGLGYPVSHLLDRIAGIMQLNKKHRAALFGAGNLGAALLHYPGFANWGFKFTNVFDNDAEKVGQKLGELTIENIASLPRMLDVSIGILAVPANVADETSRLMVKCGIKAILNFTGTKLSLPEDIVIRNVDLTNELAILIYYLISRG
ncbi:MAG: redox-sensing transcriptional repressor Rex [Firmicutes bacterium]|nr:redox-sensing transcriptional repressor Rex [Bacillota bacterium]